MKNTQERKRKRPKQDLIEAVDVFSAAIKERLNDKRLQGFTGWETPSLLNIQRRMLDKCLCVAFEDVGGSLLEKELIDIAAEAMMIYSESRAKQPKRKLEIEV